jgi:hypothetical protein
MSLSLLLDEHISQKVAVQVRSQRSGIPIQSILHWRAGNLAGKQDELLLSAAAEEGLTVITYDQKTIPPLLAEMALPGRSHAGVIFVDGATIASNDIGGLVNAILMLWEQCSDWDWTDRVVFLRRATGSV